VEISLPDQRVDFVHRVRYNGQEYLFHLEFQLEHRADLPRRLFVYAALLTEKYDGPVVTLVLYLDRRVSEVPTEYVVQLGDEVMNRFTYRVLKLWDYEEEIRSGQYRELAPLLVMLVEQPDEATLARERELILEEPDERKRGALLATAVAVASRYFERDFLWRFFREEVEQMRHASFIEDWIEEGMEEGRRKGRQEGRQEGQRREGEAILMRILARRFGRLPTRLQDRLEPLTLAQLEDLIDQAVDAEDLATFDQHLTALNGELAGR